MLENFLIDPALDALIDSVKTIPFLFVVFVFIEFFEHFWAGKIKGFLKASKKQGPLLGAAAASIPHCGFSVIASTLYTEKFITRGTIVAVYLATSDEAIPVLLMYPDYFSYILPLLLIKILIAVPVGYLVDLCFKPAKEPALKEEAPEEEAFEGCHRHNVASHRKRDFFIHPVKHTLGVFVFIFIVTLILNLILQIFDLTEIFKTGLAFLTPLIAALFGLIPNCAISVGLVIMFIKGVISFGALVSGLMTSSGIGLLILLKNNKNKKDTGLILSLLVLTGYIAGLLIQTFGPN